MLKKAIDTIKFALVLCFFVLLPVIVGMRLVENAVVKDAEGSIGSFIQDECVGLSKYVGLQLENSRIYLNGFLSQLESLDLSDTKGVQNSILDFARNDENIKHINLYDKQGKVIASSINKKGEEPEDLNIAAKSVKAANEGVSYKFSQLDDKTVVVTFLLKREIEGKAVYLEAAVKWSQYEKYMDELQQGSFSRMIYIVSPECRRYVSFNALPKKNDKQRAAALGLHLVGKLKSIKNGASRQKIDGSSFKIFKSEVKLDKQFKGAKIFVICATDASTSDSLSANLLKGMPTILWGLVGLLFVFLIVFAAIYARTREKLEIAIKIAEATPLAVVIFRASDGKILQINLSALTLYKIEKEKFATVNFWDIFVYNDDREYVATATESNIIVLNYEILAQSFGGGSFWGIISANSIEVQNEKYIVFATLDINRRKEIERKLTNNAELLEKQVTERTKDLEDRTKALADTTSLLEKTRSIADEASKAKNKFLANMSNELKAPINAIIGYAEILEEEAEDRKDTVSADDLRKILGSAKHLLSLIEQILDLSRIETGKIQFSFENTDIIGLLKDIESVTRPLVTKNDNSLFVEYNKDIGTMYTDTTKLRQCLFNLLSNASKFTQFGKITLHVGGTVKAGVDYIEFSVTDTGCGIASDKLETIFDAFGDDGSLGIGTSSGSGLGLSLTKKYLESLGGTINVESEVGVGSTFIIRIPRIAKVESNESIEVRNQNLDDDELAEQLIEEMEESEEKAESSEEVAEEGENEAQSKEQPADSKDAPVKS